jgi:hypothetical protein
MSKRVFASLLRSSLVLNFIAFAAWLGFPMSGAMASNVNAGEPSADERRLPQSYDPQSLQSESSMDKIRLSQSSPPPPPPPAVNAVRG